MRTTLLIALWVMMIVPVTAQKNIEKTLDFRGKKGIKMDIQIADSIEITTWDRNDIEVKASINLNHNKDNEAYLTSFDETGDQVIIKAKMKEGYFNNNHCCCEDTITWKISIPENTAFTVETINGNIVITGSTNEIKAKTISGFIDWTVTDGRNADLKMSTISGNIYTDLDINSDRPNNSIPQSVSQKLNGGGFPVTLESISGNIYCRKENN